MRTSDNGKNFIKSFEGYREFPYKATPTERDFTVGWGHYGADVDGCRNYSKAECEALFDSDIAKFENAVNSTIGKYLYTQNQFDAMVSFAFNCGAANLQRLWNGRSIADIPDAILLYNKAGGKVLAGLTRRRAAERELFLSDAPAMMPEYGDQVASWLDSVAVAVIDGKYGNGDARKAALGEWFYKEIQTRVNALVDSILYEEV